MRNKCMKEPRTRPLALSWISNALFGTTGYIFLGGEAVLREVIGTEIDIGLPSSR